MNVKLSWFVAAMVLVIGGAIVSADDAKPVTPAAVPAAGPGVGDVAPTFKGIDDKGQPWDLGEHVGKNYVVIYFYPADFTGGCIKQAETFRDTMNQLTEQGVIGISGDSVKNHQLFKAAWSLNYSLLALSRKMFSSDGAGVGCEKSARLV